MTSDEVRADSLAKDPKAVALRLIRLEKVLREVIATLPHSERAAVMVSMRQDNAV